MSTVSALGIGSGFLNNELVDDLAEARRGPVEQRLEFQEEETEAKLSAFGKIQSAVTEMRLPARQLSDPTAIQSFEGNSSSGAVDVEVDSEEASRGSFSVDVEQVATEHSIATSQDDLFADRDSEAVGTGDLTFEVGDRSETITLDEDNNTLNGLANAINEADVGVSANILDTGDGFRMVLNGEDTGVANEINISADGDEALQRFDTGDLGEEDSFMTETRSAQDARVNIDGVEIERSSNTIDGVVDGVTFEVNEETSSPADVTVEQDLEGPTEQVQELVDRFNELQQKVNEFTEFDTDEEEGSILTGDSAVRNTMNQIKRDLGQVVPGLEDADVRSLADVGISTDFNTGELEFDTGRFQEQLQENPDDVAALFSSQGRTSDGQVEFVRSGDDTVPGEYDIDVEEAATRGSFVGDALQDDPITIDEDNNTFSLRLNDGNQAEIELDEGDFSRQELVDEIQRQVSDNPVIDASGDRLNVSLTDNNELEFVSDKFGSESSVEILDGNDTLGLTAGEGEAGTDIVGTIDGREAQGDGQVLFLGRGEGDASGIQVRVSGDQTGDRGTVSFIEGVGSSLVDRIDDLQGEDGALTARSDSFRTELEEIDENRQDLNDRIESFRDRLVSQFTAADQRISEFEETGSFLAEQLAGMGGDG